MIKQTDIGYKDDKLFLLSIEEYKRYKDKIPHINTCWWLRSPGNGKKCASSVESRNGSVNAYGLDVVDWGNGVRPALNYTKLESKIIKSTINPNRIIYKDFPFWIIDEEKHIAIAEMPIRFDKFDNKSTPDDRFNEKSSNNYEKSYIRHWLNDFAE